MKAVLFGAGASYGSGNLLPKAPPMGSDLFAALQRLYPNWRSVPSEVAEKFEEHFESGMAVLIENYGFAVGPLMQEMARFFSIFAMDKHGSNLYRSFVEETKGCKNLILGTLNYECLLEIAISLNGQTVGYFMDPETDNDLVPVWKLHGSCNFKVKGLEATRGVSYSGTGVVFGGDIEPINPSEVQKVYSGSTALYPAMALYAAGKPISMSPGPVEAAQKRWNEHIHRCSKLLIIGVNPFPEDGHIWNSIAESNATIATIGDERAFEDWGAQVEKSDSLVILGSRWNKCADDAIEFILG